MSSKSPKFTITKRYFLKRFFSERHPWFEDVFWIIAWERHPSIISSPLVLSFIQELKTYLLFVNGLFQPWTWLFQEPVIKNTKQEEQRTRKPRKNPVFWQGSPHSKPLAAGPSQPWPRSWCPLHDLGGPRLGPLEKTPTERGGYISLYIFLLVKKLKCFWSFVWGSCVFWRYMLRIVEVWCCYIDMLYDVAIFYSLVFLFTFFTNGVFSMA